MIRNKAYFVCKEHRVVERLNPHTFVEEPSLLDSDALVHVLHHQADAMGEVTKRFLNVDNPAPSVDHRIEGRVSSVASFSPCICKDAPLLDFRWSTTNFFSPLSFLWLLLSGLFPLFYWGEGEGQEDSDEGWIGSSPVLGVECVVGVGGSIVVVAFALGAALP